MIREKILANYFWRRPTVTLKSNHCEKHIQYFYLLYYISKIYSTKVYCVLQVSDRTNAIFVRNPSPSAAHWRATA